MNRAYKNSNLEFSYVLRLINLYLVVCPFICTLSFIFLIPCLFSDKVAVFFTLFSLVYPILKVQIILAIIFLALGQITSYTYDELKSKLKRVLIHIVAWAICALIFKQIVILYFYLDPETWHYWLIGALTAIFKEFFFSPFMHTIGTCSSNNSTIKIEHNNAINDNTTLSMVGNTSNGSTSPNNASASTTGGPPAAPANQASTSNNSSTTSNSDSSSINDRSLRESIMRMFYPSSNTSEAERSLRESVMRMFYPSSNTFEAERPISPDSLDSIDWGDPVYEPESAEVIAQRVESTINEMGSDLPEHRIDGHNEVTRAGYHGGSFFDMVDERTGMDREQHGYPNFKPFTDNLADYLELYDSRRNARVNAHDFPPMDRISITWFVQWLNRCSPDYLVNRHASGPRSTNVISALRGDNNALDARIISDASTPSDGLRRNSPASTPSDK